MNELLDYMKKNKLELRISFKAKTAVIGMYTPFHREIDYSEAEKLKNSGNVDCLGGNIDLGERFYVAL